MNVCLEWRRLVELQLCPVLLLRLVALVLHLVVVVDEAHIASVLPGLGIFPPCPILHPHSCCAALLIRRIDGVAIRLPAGRTLDHLNLLGQHQTALVLALLPLPVSLGIVVLARLLIASAVVLLPLELVQILVRVGYQLAAGRTGLLEQVVPGGHALAQLGAARLEAQRRVGEVGQPFGGQRHDDTGHAQRADEEQDEVGPVCQQLVVPQHNSAAIIKVFRRRRRRRWFWKDLLNFIPSTVLPDDSLGSSQSHHSSYTEDRTCPGLIQGKLRKTGAREDKQQNSATMTFRFDKIGIELTT